MAKKSKKVGGTKAKGGKKAPDFVLTIDSDSEVENKNLDLDLDEEEDNKPGQNDQDNQDKDLNPDFQFALDDGELTGFEGWNFNVDDKNSKKEVDLDGILRAKGGLVGFAKEAEDEEDEQVNDEVEDEDEDEDEEEEEEDDDGDEEEKENDDGDDDELAMDGFGMGVTEEKEVEDSEDGQAEEVDVEDLSDADLDAEHPGSDTEEPTEDTAEQIAEFFEEADTPAGSVHASFQLLQLSRPVLKALVHLGYTKPSPIQANSIPIALMGKDIVAGAVTGSGKTAAFMIPIIERLLYKPGKVSATRVVILTPTRELAIQICDVGKKIGRFVSNLLFGLAVGGLNLRQQEQQLKTRPDIVVATPGRLIDHIRNSPSFNLESLEVLVMDEADRMLDEGFQVELTEILLLVPKHKRQTMLFSATMNTRIQDLIQLSLDKPVRIMIDPPKTAAVRLVQEFVRIRKRDNLKPALLFNLLRILDPKQENRTVVFVARKEQAHRLRVVLGLLGMKVGELHGGLTQEQRLQSVNSFKSLDVPVLVCTDLAARGLDIPKIVLVVNYDMPKSYEVYLHRVGRTARAGREGRSVTFVGESTQERGIVKDALKSLEEADNKGSKAVSRAVDWKAVEELNKVVESKQETIQEVLDEEAQQKEILQAEMELKKAQNMMDHGKEIQLRPKRTWFETEKEKQAHKTAAMHHLTKHGKKVNSKKRKRLEEKKETTRSYKKTKADRMSKPVVTKKKKKGKK